MLWLLSIGGVSGHGRHPGISVRVRIRVVFRVGDKGSGRVSKQVKVGLLSSLSCFSFGHLGTSVKVF